jgi:hypothetical protein
MFMQRSHEACLEHGNHVLCMFVATLMECSPNPRKRDMGVLAASRKTLMLYILRTG